MAEILRNVQMRELGEGIQLIFKNRDFLALQNKFGVGWFQHLLNVIDQYDVEAMDFCLTIGGKKDGKQFKITIDDVEPLGPLSIASERILDALCLSINGKTYVDMIQDIAKRLGERADGLGDADPPLSPEASSASSAAEPSGQV